MTLVDIAPADQAAVEAMWASYVADSGYDGPLVTAFAFGDSAEMAGELGLLVLHGPKRATAELVQAYAAQGEPLPRAGDRCVGRGGDGRPLAAVRTTDVRVGPPGRGDDHSPRCAAVSGGLSQCNGGDVGGGVWHRGGGAAGAT